MKFQFVTLFFFAIVLIVSCNNEDDINTLNSNNPYAYYKPDKMTATIPAGGGSDTIRVFAMSERSIGSFPVHVVSVEVRSNGRNLSVQQRDSTLFTGDGFSVLSTKSADPKVGYVILNVDKELSNAGYEMKVILDKYSKNMETAWTFTAQR